jgi:hypothetical protein
MDDDSYVLLSEHYRWYQSTREFEDVRDGRRYPDSLYSSKVDVYEDRVRTWFLDLAIRETAAGSSPGDYVALSIALAYIEGVEQYRRGKPPPRGEAGKWFESSARRVFPTAPNDAIRRLWAAVRCGLFHSGFTEGPTLLSHTFDQALEVSGEYLRVNPAKFVRSAFDDFDAYVRELRANPLSELANQFVIVWDTRWDEA